MAKVDGLEVTKPLHLVKNIHIRKSFKVELAVKRANLNIVWSSTQQLTH